ncbi:hypothetical protein [Streptomyces sp. 8N616]|uniref:hypothetical protein n=1 Tax=Streptomyces sp. 8N616 TaxID=3457414 RepID=UPI003FD33C7A
MCADLPDAELIELVRVGTPLGDKAMDELNRRHLPAVLAYARICSIHDHAAEALAARALTLALREIRSGVSPRETWRYHLLLLVQRAAVRWAVGTRRAELTPRFATWIDDVRADEQDRTAALPLEENSTVLRGFRALPVPTQGLLWHTVVEEDPDDRVARLLGLRPESIPHVKSRALDALRDAYLQAYLRGSDDPQCRGFGRIIKAVARPDDPRRSDDLDRHLTGCPGCTQALGVLIALSERPGLVLAEGLLMWGGTGYLASSQGHSLHDTATAAARAQAADRDETIPVPVIDEVRETRPLSRPPAAARPRRHGRGLRSPAAASALVAALVASAATGFLVLGPSGASDPGTGADKAKAPRSPAAPAPTTSATHPPTAGTPLKKPSDTSRPEDPARRSAPSPSPSDPTPSADNIPSDQSPSPTDASGASSGSGNGNGNGNGNFGSSNGQSNGQGFGF